MLQFVELADNMEAKLSSSYWKCSHVHQDELFNRACGPMICRPTLQASNWIMNFEIVWMVICCRQQVICTGRARKTTFLEESKADLEKLRAGVVLWQWRMALLPKPQIKISSALYCFCGCQTTFDSKHSGPKSQNVRPKRFVTHARK